MILSALWSWDINENLRYQRNQRKFIGLHKHRFWLQIRYSESYCGALSGRSF